MFTNPIHYFRRERSTVCHGKGRLCRESRETKKRMENGQSQTQNSIQPAPLFPPERVRKLLLNLKSCLGWAEGQPLSFEDWSSIAGRPGNTLASWCESGEAHQLQALFASLERLPEATRHQLIDETCRTHPTLQHRKLSHDCLATSRLKKILLKTSGTTLIQGNPAHMRTFLLVAIGNSFNQAHPGVRAVAGLDIHPAEALAPVIGVTYLPNLNGAGIAKRINEAWRFIRGSAARLLLVNGALGRAPELQEEIARCARQAHVIIADEYEVTPRDIGRSFPPPVHLLTVAPAREVPEWIRVEIAPL